MIKKINGLLCFVLISMTFACSSDSDEPNNNQEPTSPSAPITASINGQSWASMTEGVQNSLQIVEMTEAPNETIIQIIGTKTDESRIIIEFPVNNLAVGTHTFTDHTNGTLVYSSPESGFHTSYQDGGSFSITISEVNASTGKISGTFSGTVIDSEGNSKTINNGTVNSVSVFNNIFYSNGTMSLSKNGGTAFSMDNDQSDAKYMMLFEDWFGIGTLSMFGYNSTVSNDKGFYNVTLPKNVAPGTYDLTSDEGFNAIIGTSENQNEFNVTSGSVTVTSHSSNNIVGTFSFTASNGTETVTISNGSFNITHN